MKIHTSLLAILTLTAPLAHAMAIDAKALARFDRSYIVCEAKFPAMKGQRDEAYLSMWRIRPDQKARTELATVRKSVNYQSERALIQKDSSKGTSPAMSKRIEQECQALWAETQRINKKAK